MYSNTCTYTHDYNNTCTYTHDYSNTCTYTHDYSNTCTYTNDYNNTCTYKHIITYVVYILGVQRIFVVFKYSLFWYPNVFLASIYSFNVCTCTEIEHVRL